MNRLLTPLTNAIVDRKGTIDKYIGDAIMAFWNAPLDDAAQEANACEAALRMLEALERLNAERRAEAEASGPSLPADEGRASASTPARASSATWAPTCTSTIRSSAMP